MQIITCPVCGNNASFLVVQGLTVTACLACCQAVIAENDIIIRIDRNKLIGYPIIQQEFLMIALVAKALYENLDIVSNVSMSER